MNRRVFFGFLVGLIPLPFFRRKLRHIIDQDTYAISEISNKLTHTVRGRIESESQLTPRDVAAFMETSGDCLHSCFITIDQRKSGYSYRMLHYFDVPWRLLTEEMRELRIEIESHFKEMGVGISEFPRGAS